MGAGADPLYWGPIFSALVARGVTVRVLVGHALDGTTLKGCAVAPPMRSRSFFKFRVPRLRQLIAEIRAHRGVCVVNEFGPSSIMALLLCRLFGNRPTVLLVENDAKFLVRNHIHRDGIVLILRRALAGLADVVLTNNAYGHRYVSETLHVCTAKVITGPYLTSELPRAVAAPRNSAPRPCGGKVTFVAVGRLIPSKGFECLLRELALLPCATQDRIGVTIFGDGPSRDSLTHAIAAAGLGDRVRFAGRGPYSELGDRMSGFDCFLMPTLADYRSLSSFEAIGLGLPVLMSVHDGALSEVLEEGVNGFAFDPEVPGSMAAAMSSLCDALDSGRQLGDESKRIAANFTVDRAAAVLLAAIDGACRANAQPLR